MPTYTTNYNLAKPIANSAVDEDLWGEPYLNDNMDIIDAQMKTNADNATTALTRATLPVGSVFFTVINTNPGTLLGYGTWVQIAQGRFIVGVGTGTDANADTRSYAQGNDSVGEYTHTLITAEMPAHSHPQNVSPNQGGALTGNFASTPNSVGNVPSVTTTDSVGGDDPHENSPPAFGLYVWERTV